MDELEKKELQNCNFVKAILMMSIIIFHSGKIYATGNWGPYPAVDTAPFIGLFINWLGSFLVFAFTLISGYIFYHQKYERNKYQKFSLFVVNKAKRLLIPYVFITCIWLIPTYLYFYGNITNIISKYVLCINPSQLWFLWMLFWVFIIYWILSDVINKHPYGGLFIVCICWIIGYVWPLTNLFMFKQGLQYLIFFYIGVMIRKYGTSYLNRIHAITYVIADFILFVTVMWIGKFDGITYRLFEIGGTLILNALGAVMAFVVLQQIAVRVRKDNRVISFLYKYSMTIYLVHQQLIYFSISIFNGHVAPIILVLINFVFSFVLSAMFAWLMSMTETTRTLVGLQ